MNHSQARMETRRRKAGFKETIPLQVFTPYLEGKGLDLDSQFKETRKPHSNFIDELKIVITGTSKEATSTLLLITTLM